MSITNGYTRLTFRGVADLLGLPIDQHSNILGDHILEKGQPAAIFGEGGLGKSFISLQLPVSQILGRPLFDNPELRFHGPPIKWVIIQTENGIKRQQGDLRILQTWAGKDWKKIEPFLSIHTLETTSDAMVKLDDEKVREDIAEHLCSFGANAVIIDPASDFLPGDLNVDSTMKHSCTLLSKTCRTNDPSRLVVVLHHAITGRMGASRATGYDRSSFGRNSKMLHAWARGVFNVAPGAEDNSTLVVSCGKCSNGQAFKSFAITRGQDEPFKLNPDFDFSKWERQMAGQFAKKETPVKTALEVISANKDNYTTRTEMVDFLMESQGLARSTAFSYVAQAVEKKIFAPLTVIVDV